MRITVLLSALTALCAVYMTGCNSCNGSDTADHTTGMDAVSDQSVTDGRSDVVADAAADTKSDGGAGAAGSGGGNAGKGGDGGGTGGDAAVDPDGDTDAKGDSGDTDAKADGGAPDAQVIDADFGYDAAVGTPWETIPSKCRDSAEKGVQWLASVQTSSGRWGSSDHYYNDGATALAITKLETYALEHGLSPFNPVFKYYTHIKKGFEYLFTRFATYNMPGDPNDSNGDGIGLRYNNSAVEVYVTSLALMAVTAGQGFDQVANSPSSPVHNWTFQKIAQNMVDYLAKAQIADSGWRYRLGDGGADNSNTQYVTLAFEYAQHPDYQFFCDVPKTVPLGLEKWVTYIQNDNGSSGYAGPGEPYSPMYRTGALLQELAYMKKDITHPIAVKALDYIDKNFDSAYTFNYDHGGYKGRPDYMAMWSIMKGLVTQGIDKVGSRDWYQLYCDRLVSEQEPAGNWPAAAWDNNSITGNVLSTTFALLVLEKAAPPKTH